MSRITNNVIINNTKRNLYRNLNTMEKIQEQLSTGKKISKPSDDPVGLVNAMRLRTNLGEINQHKSNIDDGKEWLNSTDSSLGKLGDVLQRVRELTVYGSNGTLEGDQRKAISAEVKQLIDEVGNIANSTHGERYIFGGTRTTKAPYNKGSDLWEGNNNAIEFEIGIGTKIPININALDDVFKVDASKQSQLIADLKAVADHLDNSDIATLSSVDLQNLDDHIDSILEARAHVGARINRLEMVQDKMSDLELNFTQLLSKAEDADIAQVIMDLKTQESVYRAALSASSRIIQPTLVDFLR